MHILSSQAQKAGEALLTASDAMSAATAAAQAKLLKRMLGAQMQLFDLKKEIKDTKEEMAKHITKVFGKFMPKAAVAKLAKVCAIARNSRSLFHPPLSLVSPPASLPFDHRSICACSNSRH